MALIYLHNTMTGKKELFKPIHGPFLGCIGRPRVGMYHCGPTVYWDQHLGNMRAAVLSDLVRRVFLSNGYNVDFVRNYTDVGHLTGDNIGDADTGEDRMEKAAKREHALPDEIAIRYIQNFDEDIRSLNVLPPTHAPRATDHIGDMIRMVQTLLDKGFAYIAPQAVYFDVSKFPAYTKLSGQRLEDQEAGQGQGAVSDRAKRNAHDFALWFFKVGVHADALQTWPSPWGEGFPGWHIECSAMSKHYLGPTIDVHMGGVEHIPIHHTNEIAQSESANGVRFVNYWLHNEHLLVDSKKMSKSEGTSYLVRDVVGKGFSPIALRYFFLQAHYRSKQNFTWESLSAATTALKRLKDGLASLPDHGRVDSRYRTAFFEKINDDFNISAGLALVWDILKDRDLGDADKKATVLSFDNVLGLELNKKESASIPVQVQKLANERQAARLAKDWKRSDELRDQIGALGYEVKDTPEGQKLNKE